MILVGVPGLEPGKTGPESVVLPITPYPNLKINCRMPSRIWLVCECKFTALFHVVNAFDVIFCNFC